MTPAIPVSVVDFVNAWPVTWGFLRGAVEGFLPITDVPSACAERLARGEVQAGLVPAIEAARIPGVRIVRGVGIASYARVRSVLLVSRKPLGEIRTVALDVSSRSSAAMARILLEDLYGLKPEFHRALPDLPRMLETDDAALVIGDPALRADLAGLHVLDLAEGWGRLTGLP
ncbi:MAG: menaquinone biosynthesis protein, partial [Thermoanaerobaculia bacterium]|nr:menaquinone biosynthesis protein [Thermoanaerobaculia bacterium]